MKANKLIYIFLLALLFISCEKEIDYKGETKESTLVLNGIVENDSTFRLYLERSFFFLSKDPTSDKFISSGASLTLTNLSTGQSYSMSASTVDNVYDFPFVTTPNTKYKIEISHPDYKTISAETTTVPKIDLISVDTSSYTKDGSNYKKAILTWNDPAGENYYFIRVNYNYVDPITPANNYSYYTSFTCSDEAINNGSNTAINGSSNYYEEIIFNDAIFEGKKKSLEIELNDYNSLGSSFTYELITVNKETYLYYTSCKDYFNSGGFFTEPIQIYTNINNGFGIFGTKNTSKITK